MNISDYINESLNESFDFDGWLSKSSGLSRNKMPQVDKDAMDYVLLHMARKHKITKKQVPISRLRPIQSELNMDKVNKMVKGGDAINRTYIVSNKYGLADGTHGIASLLANDKSNDEQLVTVYRTNLPCKKLIEIMNKLKVTYKKEIHESQNK